MASLHRQAPGNPPSPHGHGFMAPTRRNRAGKSIAAAGPPDPDDVLLEGLAQGVEDGGGELPQLVQEQDAGVGQRDLAGPEPRRPTSHDRHLGRTVVRRPQGGP